ncbi:hypothetical protein AAG570_005927 [Ranatra chinensis]|uniref:Uncharacterized protein n=1 Tax=Ranatra chinensis TaxID=642074 RepID=A0ABD0XWJ4_9HEMI
MPPDTSELSEEAIQLRFLRQRYARLPDVAISLCYTALFGESIHLCYLRQLRYPLLLYGYTTMLSGGGKVVVSVCDYQAEGLGFDSLRGQFWLKARLAYRPLGAHKFASERETVGLTTLSYYVTTESYKNDMDQYIPACNVRHDSVFMLPVVAPEPGDGISSSEAVVIASEPSSVHSLGAVLSGSRLSSRSRWPMCPALQVDSARGVAVLQPPAAAAPSPVVKTKPDLALTWTAFLARLRRPSHKRPRKRHRDQLRRSAGGDSRNSASGRNAPGMVSEFQLAESESPRLESTVREPAYSQRVALTLRESVYSQRFVFTLRESAYSQTVALTLR